MAWRVDKKVLRVGVDGREQSGKSKFGWMDRVKNALNKMRIIAEPESL